MPKHLCIVLLKNICKHFPLSLYFIHAITLIIFILILKIRSRMPLFYLLYKKHFERLFPHWKMVYSVHKNQSSRSQMRMYLVYTRSLSLSFFVWLLV